MLDSILMVELLISGVSPHKLHALTLLSRVSLTQDACSIPSILHTRCMLYPRCPIHALTCPIQSPLLYSVARRLYGPQRYPALPQVPSSILPGSILLCRFYSPMYYPGYPLLSSLAPFPCCSATSGLLHGRFIIYRFLSSHRYLLTPLLLTVVLLLALSPLSLTLVLLRLHF